MKLLFLYLIFLVIIIGYIITQKSEKYIQMRKSMIDHSLKYGSSTSDYRRKKIRSGF